jgi:4-hydroxy-tetrahydrodipicolinate synthase
MTAFAPEQFHGIIPPILTPFEQNGQVDLRSLYRLTRWLIIEGVHGIWACGTTGEFACIDADERENVVGTCVESADGRVPVVANISDCSTRLAVEHGQRALRAGADAVAATPPYYYLNSQDELLAHYRQIREQIDAPLFVYNIPSTCKVRVEIETIVTLAAEGTVIGTKDSQSDLVFARQLAKAAEDRGAPLRLLLGIRTIVDAMKVLGVHGVITGLANVAPHACVQAYEAAKRGDWAAADEAQRVIDDAAQLTKVAAGSNHSASFGGMKAALKAMGIIADATVAAPLRTPSPEEQERIAALTRDLKLRQPVTA